jgi:hypothetical protein
VSNKLIQIIDDKTYEETSYDCEEVFEILSEIPGIRDLRKGVDVVCGEYHTDLGWTYVELCGDAKLISMQHSDDVALQLALEINQRYKRRHGASLQICDAGYNFHVKLEGIETLAELHAAIGPLP